MNLRVLGVDPGLDAYACVYRPGSSIASGLRWQFLDLPTWGQDASRRIDARAFRDWLRRHDPTHAYIENVGPMRGQGLGHTSRFLRAVGSIETVVACCDIDAVLVAPQRWKRFYEIPKQENPTKAKEYSRVLMLQLAPELAPVLARKMDHGRAEAALLALYGAHKQSA